MVYLCNIIRYLLKISVPRAYIYLRFSDFFFHLRRYQICGNKIYNVCFLFFGLQRIIQGNLNKSSSPQGIKRGSIPTYCLQQNHRFYFISKCVCYNNHNETHEHTTINLLNNLIIYKQPLGTNLRPKSAAINVFFSLPFLRMCRLIFFKTSNAQKSQ